MTIQKHDAGPRTAHEQPEWGLGAQPPNGFEFPDSAGLGLGLGSSPPTLTGFTRPGSKEGSGLGLGLGFGIG